MHPNRIVAVASSVLVLALALVPAVFAVDWTTTAGVGAGIVAVLGIVLKWLDGWQKFEANTGYGQVGVADLHADQPPVTVPPSDPFVLPQDGAGESGVSTEPAPSRSG